MSNILKIKSMSAPWQGLNYSVSWDGRGVVAQPTGIKAIWDTAVKSCKKGYRVGFSFGAELVKEAIVLDIATMYDYSDAALDHLSYLVKRFGGIEGVAFTYREEAEMFVEELEKVIMWKMLKKEYHE